MDQDCGDWECIIVDDGSDDHRVRMMCNGITDARVQYHYQERKERSIARNTGIDLASGKYICFLDDDDTYLACYLSDFMDAAGDHLDTILRTGYRIRKEEDGEIRDIKASNYKVGLHQNPVQFAAYYMMGVWSLCIPATYLEDDRFPSEFPHWQDTHLILRLLAKHNFVQLSHHNYIYHQHQAMGSEHLFSSTDLIDRTERNVAAIDDLFENHSDLVASMLPADTHRYLRAEKYLRNASIAAKRNENKIAWNLLKRGKYEGRLWKSYARVVKEILT